MIRRLRRCCVGKGAINGSGHGYGLANRSGHGRSFFAAVAILNYNGIRSFAAGIVVGSCGLARVGGGGCLFFCVFCAKISYLRVQLTACGNRV